MSKIKGTDLMLFLNGRSIAYATNHTLDIDTETTDFSCKDEGAEGWNNQEVSLLNWTCTSENLYSVNGEGDNYIDLFDLMLERQPIDAVFCKKAEQGNDVPVGGWTPESKPFVGQVLITDLSLNAPHDDYATYSVTFEGYGELKDLAKENYLTFEAIEDAQFSFIEPWKNDYPLMYSLDEGVTWDELDLYDVTPVVHAGEKIMWKSHMNAQFIDHDSLDAGLGKFRSTGFYKASGNPLSIAFDNFASIRDISEYPHLLQMLFQTDEHLVDAYDMEFKDVKLSLMAYYQMFAGCTNLKRAPKELLSMNLAYECYGSMFSNCVNLETVPTLPATELAESCYRNMYYHCREIRYGNYLPARILVKNCYRTMYLGCEKLSYVCTAATDSSAEDCVTEMFENQFNSNNCYGTQAYEYWNAQEIFNIKPQNWVTHYHNNTLMPKLYDDNGVELKTWDGSSTNIIKAIHLQKENPTYGTIHIIVIDQNDQIAYESDLQIQDKNNTRLPSISVANPKMIAFQVHSVNASTSIAGQNSYYVE